MKMKRYLIKVTHTEGIHTGKSYLLQKGGHATDEQSIQFIDTTYKTLAIAKRVCKRLYEENERKKRIEIQNEAIRIKRGFSPKSFFIYESNTYEPFEVEVIDY